MQSKDLNLELMIVHAPLAEVLALAAAHEDVRSIAAEDALPSSWIDTIPAPTAATVPAAGQMRRAA